jgi:hypothetical protein
LKFFAVVAVLKEVPQAGLLASSSDDDDDDDDAEMIQTASFACKLPSSCHDDR